MVGSSRLIINIDSAKMLKQVQYKQLSSTSIICHFEKLYISNNLIRFIFQIIT